MNLKYVVLILIFVFLKSTSTHYHQHQHASEYSLPTFDQVGFIVLCHVVLKSANSMGLFLSADTKQIHLCFYYYVF